MNTLTYKDYIGSVNFSEKDNVFFGKVEGINALVNFEGESVSELRKAFQEAVDDYLAYCEEEGIEPHKSYSGSLNVRISPEIHNKIAMLAKQAGISINAFIKEALEKQVASSFCHTASLLERGFFVISFCKIKSPDIASNTEAFWKRAEDGTRTRDPNLGKVMLYQLSYFRN